MAQKDEDVNGLNKASKKQRKGARRECSNEHFSAASSEHACWSTCGSCHVIRRVCIFAYYTFGRFFGILYYIKGHYIRLAIRFRGENTNTSVRVVEHQVTLKLVSMRLYY